MLIFYVIFIYLNQLIFKFYKENSIYMYLDWLTIDVYVVK